MEGFEKISVSYIHHGALRRAYKDYIMRYCRVHGWVSEQAFRGFHSYPCADEGTKRRMENPGY